MYKNKNKINIDQQYNIFLNTLLLDFPKLLIIVVFGHLFLTLSQTSPGFYVSAI